ncbi:MAG: hypothetical protein ACTTHG_06095 [Treponemataceae bacterium]
MYIFLLHGQITIYLSNIASKIFEHSLYSAIAQAAVVIILTFVLSYLINAKATKQTILK